VCEDIAFRPVTLGLRVIAASCVCHGDPAARCYVLRLGRLQRALPLRHGQKEIF